MYGTLFVLLLELLFKLGNIQWSSDPLGCSAYLSFIEVSHLRTFEKICVVVFFFFFFFVIIN